MQKDGIREKIREERERSILTGLAEAREA